MLVDVRRICVYRYQHTCCKIFRTDKPCVKHKLWSAQQMEVALTERIRPFSGPRPVFLDNSVIVYVGTRSLRACMDMLMQSNDIPFRTFFIRRANADELSLRPTLLSIDDRSEIMANMFIQGNDFHDFVVFSRVNYFLSENLVFIINPRWRVTRHSN